jgi:DNA-binding NarL/FixJ family response regulator
VERPETLVAVEADGPLRLRILAALEADRISIALNGGSDPPDVRVVGVDLSQCVARQPLRGILGSGNGRIVAVSPDCGATGVRRAMKAGADSVVLEQDLEDALAPAVRAVAAGLSVMPTLLRRGAERIAFSHREREVLRLAVQGHTNSEIAAELFLAESTVKSHLSSVYRKLGAKGRKDAASLILDPDEGLVDLFLGGKPHNGEARAAGAPHLPPMSSRPRREMAQ